MEPDRLLTMRQWLIEADTCASTSSSMSSSDANEFLYEVLDLLRTLTLPAAKAHSVGLPETLEALLPRHSRLRLLITELLAAWKSASGSESGQAARSVQRDIIDGSPKKSLPADIPSEKQVVNRSASHTDVPASR